MRRSERLLGLGWTYRNWYSRANREIMRWSDRRNVDPATCAAALAIASPRVQVSRSVRIAKYWLLNGRLPDGVLGMVHSGFAHYEDTGEIRGRKTYPFYRALLGDHDALVLDVWMARAFRVDQRIIHRSDVATDITAEVSYLARRNRCTIRQAQAAIWAGVIFDWGRNPYYLTMGD